MASFDNIATIAADAGFLKRVAYAMTVAAVNVAAEVATTQDHALRREYAQKIFLGTASTSAMALGVLTNSTISAEANSATAPDFAIPDSDIQFAVNSLFGAFAGAG